MVNECQTSSTLLNQKKVRKIQNYATEKTIPYPGLEPRTSCLAVGSFNHYTIGSVLCLCLLNCYTLSLLILLFFLSGKFSISSQFQLLSIPPVFAKTFETIMFEQMADYVIRNYLISPFQSGFRPGYSTALVRVSNDIHSNLELNHPTIVVLHVFSKALIEYALDYSFINCVNVMDFTP
jgi:hypothetical protein